MKLCNKFMLRRTSTVLKALLPAKVEQVGGLGQPNDCQTAHATAAPQFCSLSSVVWVYILKGLRNNECDQIRHFNGLI